MRRVIRSETEIMAAADQHGTRHRLVLVGALLVGVAALVSAAVLLNSRPLAAQQADAQKPGQPPPTTQPTTAQATTREADEHRPWPRPSTRERQADRQRMVDRQIAPDDLFRSGVRDKEVLDAMRAVPRHEFVPSGWQSAAYDDTPLPIGHGQTISQPYIVALMTKHLELQAGDKVLEIGTGSGYQAAVLTELTPHVYTIEIVKPLHEEATRRLKRLGYTTIETRLADGYDGWPQHAPFDAVIVTCAAGHVPPPLWKQLKPGGRMVIPIGGVHDVQRLIVLTKQPDGRQKSRSILPVRFVPMVGKAQEDD
jgi:protein-L-isoaspartate(D-aspartate) O-methyltransferase